VTATLPRPHVEMDTQPQPARAAVLARWHELRRLVGVVTFGLAVVSGIVLLWPAMIIVAALGAGVAIDGTLAMRSQRTSVGPTLVVDITFTGIGLIAASVPAPAIGMVVAYYVLLIAVLSTSVSAWPIGLYAVVVGVTAAVVPSVFDTTDSSLERSLTSGIIVTAVFGIAAIVMVREFTAVHEHGSETTGRRLEIADAIARASTALVAEDDAAGLASALEAVRQAINVSVVFVERNAEDPDLGLTATVVERASARPQAHPSVDRQTRVPWSAMPGARAHLEGGAPFFYRIEEVRGTSGDRGGDLGLRVEVNVPVTMHDEWVGVVGAADEDADRVWRTDDLLLLRTLASLTAAHWQREADGKVRDSLIGSLDGRLRHVEATAHASRALLGEHSADLAPAADAIGIAAGVDEVFITATIPGEDATPWAEVVASWTGPGIVPTLTVGSRWSYTDREDTRAALQHGDLHTADVGGRSHLVAGIEAAGTWFGSVGFVSHSGTTAWSSSDQAFLHTFADMLGAFYERRSNRQHLERSLQAKEQLIASVSHELRTPLTVVVGLAEELRSAGDAIDADERDQLLGVIADESGEMADLVEDMLIAARSDDGTIPVFPERVDLALLARNVVNHLTIPDGTTVDIDDADSVAFADPVRVRQVLRNLLTNAFRYGGNSVTVTFGCDEDRSWVDVHDDGDGIPDEDRDAIFEAYGRSSTGRSVKASVGLGLTLSRRLADLMGGSLTHLDGSGCTFRLAVPQPERPGS
jgi:signal transduction histidine kinase